MLDKDEMTTMDIILITINDRLMLNERYMASVPRMVHKREKFVYRAVLSILNRE